MDSHYHDWEWQKLHFGLEFRKVDGDSFETFFQEIAKRRWKTCFTPTIPMGRRGDLKCDGFRSDTGEVFQCYGPRYGKANVDEALKKINEDFHGAKAHWQEAMKKWVFVVNLFRDRVPSELVRRVSELSRELSVPAEIWSYDELEQIASTLDSADREALFGRPPSRGDMVRGVTYANIGRALAFLRAALAQETGDPIKLPAPVEEKMEFNLLPASTRYYLSIGQLGADRVKQYLSDQTDPQEAQSMADGFKNRYRDVLAQAAEPSEVFRQLIIFAGGATGDTDRDSSALAIVTHFFSVCEIFETPPLADAK